MASGAVAYSIVALLPLELVLHSGSGAGGAMIFALLISAIIWNVGTWYLGLPASSSHTLIGAIMGVGVANSMMAGNGMMAGINWTKATEIGMALLLSPLVGFFGAAILFLTVKFLIRRDDLYQAPEKDSVPPLWIRGLLMLSCTLVSFFHGSNDGQKGMGLIMLILVGLVPGAFALNMASDPARLSATVTELRHLATLTTPLANGATISDDDATSELTRYAKAGGKPTPSTYAAISLESQAVADHLEKISDMNAIPHDERVGLRTDSYLIGETLNKMIKGKQIADPAAASAIKKTKGDLDNLTKYIPTWVKVAVALALGLGTMIGWKRIVVTVGEKIGKSHLTYAQGASAELMAAATIGLADGLGLPVSTTHVLSSGIAGTMAANKSGLQKDTLISILLAWVLTLPVCIFLGATLFSAALYVAFHVFGIQ
jgi:PiT family inorganic phosphate transporter